MEWKSHSIRAVLVMAAGAMVGGCRADSPMGAEVAAVPSIGTEARANPEARNERSSEPSSAALAIAKRARQGANVPEVSAVGSRTLEGRAAAAQFVAHLERIVDDPELRSRFYSSDPAEVLLREAKGVLDGGRLGTPNAGPSLSMSDDDDWGCYVNGSSTLYLLNSYSAAQGRQVWFTATTYSPCSNKPFDTSQLDTRMRLTVWGTDTFSKDKFHQEYGTAAYYAESVTLSGDQRQNALMSTKHYGGLFMRPDANPDYSSAAGEV